ncbi:hypothetical protein CBZ85_23710 [Salmonella enterica subsp. enterica serovar Heidelberg]|nr:hypothetical protein [Salmonella enterica subsp. enterica serovar Heidelberg]
MAYHYTFPNVDPLVGMRMVLRDNLLLLVAGMRMVLRIIPIGCTHFPFFFFSLWRMPSIHRKPDLKVCPVISITLCLMLDKPRQITCKSL